MLIAEKEGFAIEDDNDEREEEKRSENKLENKDEDELKVKRRRPSSVRFAPKRMFCIAVAWCE